MIGPLLLDSFKVYAPRLVQWRNDQLLHSERTEQCVSALKNPAKKKLISTNTITRLEMRKPGKHANNPSFCQKNDRQT